ncbi:DUF3618 domain-containing protein [Devosia nitrariae]|uniref:Nutrient deprivation-induced protein n=1 Tax=Devosia nitrariae TaxID=2071872 RepID=A0ABQ5W7R5_9HYPH|nr:DUF3618 domain-containing protein [Devosia nitrariae]GLQ55808.1 nutrient deprivation-induced protein [Devosia nitrariae]
MMAYEEHRSSEELQRDIDHQRHAVESRLDSLQARLSPGQLLDEALRYTREGPGAEYVDNLKRSATQNPIPVALLGISLAWLMGRPAAAPASDNHQSAFNEDLDYDPYPLATVKGTSLQRLGHSPYDDGRHQSEFVDDAGKKYRAFADETGSRAGHFVDETGNTFRGFMDEAGNRVTEFRDEAGNLLDEATGWASHSWRAAGSAMHRAKGGIDSLRDRTMHAGEGLYRRADQFGGGLEHFLRDQPLVAGALAFAIGAAIGAAAPHTREEDELMGEASDRLKDRAADEARDLYREGKEQVQQRYGEAKEEAARLYEESGGISGQEGDGPDPADRSRPH